jgi:hypothetical protein
MLGCAEMLRTESLIAICTRERQEIFPMTFVPMTALADKHHLALILSLSPSHSTWQRARGGCSTAIMIASFGVMWCAACTHDVFD